MPRLKSRLRSFWPIPGTQFIFCELCKGMHPHKHTANQRFTNLIINIKTGKCELRVDWYNLVPDKARHSKSSRHTEYKGIIVNHENLSLIYEQVFRYDSSEFRRNPEVKKSPFNTFKKKKDMWRIDLFGGSQKIENPPDLFIHNQASHRCLDFSSLVALTSSKLIQFQLDENSLQTNEDWQNIGDALMKLCSLPHGGYVFSNSRKGTVNFLQPYEPRFRSFQIKSIFAELPPPPREITLWENLSSLSWQLVPLSAESSSPMLAYFQMPGFPVFEIHLDRIKDGKAKDVFNFLGYSPSCRPFLSMKRNRVILFSNSLIRSNQDLNTSVPIFLVEKQYRNWPVNAAFCFQPEPIPLPASIHRICEIPFNDENLLAYGQDTFWYVYYDGSSVKPLYPRARPMRRKGAKPRV